MAAVFVLHRQNCIRKHIMFNKKRRPVFRVGWAVEYEGMRWVEVQGEKLLPFCSDVDVSRSYPVFVQSHALERMKERLNPIPQHDVLLNLSFERGELSRNVAGQLLIAVRFNECKLGYLLADFVENQLVVRSFLFITHTGTSEGNAFNERLRIQSYSKKYFGLDSLVTYIVTDICIDPFFRSVLTECGCEDLIKFRQLFSVEIKDRLSPLLKMKLR
jgi:hypothetical protein